MCRTAKRGSIARSEHWRERLEQLSRKQTSMLNRPSVFLGE